MAGAMQQRSFAAATWVVAAVAALLLQGCLHKKNCAIADQNCMDLGCCITPGHKCFVHTETYAVCAASCTNGLAGKCKEVKPKGTTTPAPGESEVVSGTSEEEPAWGEQSSDSVEAPVGTSPASASAKATPKARSQYQDPYTHGTWATSYWDCCKPSCGWDGEGDLDRAVRSCDAKTMKPLESSDINDVCNDGGTATMCPDQQPFALTDRVSLGFASISAAAKDHGLKGSDTCGQCYELVFTGQQHVNAKKEKWGGAHPDVVDKRMVVQVVNVGVDVAKNHSFEILMPGAGQGVYAGGCKKTFSNTKEDDFDCGMRHGGCGLKEDCKKLPPALRKGCEWRFDWLMWLKPFGQGRTNVPYLKFRRVQCPKQLVDITGAQPTDDLYEERIDLPSPSNKTNGSKTEVKEVVL